MVRGGLRSVSAWRRVSMSMSSGRSLKCGWHSWSMRRFRSPLLGRVLRFAFFVIGFESTLMVEKRGWECC